MLTIGTCGNCGGRVSFPTHMVNPVARCESCGATPRESFGRIIPMNPPKDKEKSSIKLWIFDDDNLPQSKFTS